MNLGIEPLTEPPLDRLIVTIFSSLRSSNTSNTEYKSDERLKDAHTNENSLTENEGSSMVPSEGLTRILSDFMTAHLADSQNSMRMSLFCNDPVNSDIQQLTYSFTHPTPDFTKARHTPAFKAYEREHSVEIIFDQIPTPSSTQAARPLKLALFDMDSTLINEEVIDELARSIGKTDIVSAITARAMNGEIDFETSLRERVAMLKGVRSDVWDELKGTVTIAEGARELIQGLKKMGVVTGVVSGGFVPMAEWLKGELGLDYAFANHVRGQLMRQIESHMRNIREAFTEVSAIYQSPICFSSHASSTDIAP